MQKNSFITNISFALKNAFSAFFLISGVTIVLLVIGKNYIGEAVIALLYKAAISFCAARWGQLSGVTGSLLSALYFDYFFIPPTFTFTVGSLEGWLVLIIFLLVSIVVVGQIQSSIKDIKSREWEALAMYEIVSGLSTLHSRESISVFLASMIQAQLQAKQVNVIFNEKGLNAKMVFQIPERLNTKNKADLVLTIENQMSVLGEISIWKGDYSLPTNNDWLLQSFIRQTAIALDRVDNNNANENYSQPAGNLEKVYD